MGAFFKSFWSQMGRSTGKRVSNAVFGDKWATPYRVAVNKSKGKRRDSYSGDNSRRQYRRGAADYSRSRAASRPRSNNWLYWLGGFILFAGTYDAILKPNKDNVVLILMLWGVAIAFYLHKKRKNR